MKIGRFLLKITCNLTVKGDAKRLKTYPPHGAFEERLDIPYLDDGEELHKFDLYYADKTKENYKGVCVVDIHGGSYLFGSRKNNYAIGLEFLKEGYDFIAIDYVPIKDQRNIDNLIDECAECLAYIAAHKKELGIENDRFVLIGDSAGGHMALTIQIASDDKEYAKAIGIDLGEFKSEAVLVNCSVFDYESISILPTLRKSGKRMMLGPRYDDLEFLRLYSPKTHFDKLHSPIFASTCAKDFIRPHPLMLIEAIKARKDLVSETLDIKDESVGHVHNVTDPHLPASKEVNGAMARFIEKALKLN